MDTQTPCPSKEQWQQFLQESLDDREQTKLGMHLDECSDCQTIVETLSGNDSMLGLARQVGQENRDGESVLQEVLEQAKQAEPETLALGTRGKCEDDFAYLQPSDKSEHLGRLDHYEIMEKVGQGAFGTVFRAFDTKLHRVVAIKVLSPELAANGTARQRFIREARTVAAVTHEHVVTIHSVAEEHRPPYLVMQFVDGKSLQEKLNDEGALTITEVLRIGMQIADGLAAADKQGLVHRDIKPSNILLENGVERVQITDFGLAKVADDASVTQSGVIAGTPLYMSPEQASGEAIDHRSDLFSLGTVLYVMCTGRPPFRASGTMAVLKRVCEDTPRPIREINPEVPQYLADIICKLHAKNRRERFQSASEVADLLGQHLAQLQRPLTSSGPQPVLPAPVTTSAPSDATPRTDSVPGQRNPARRNRRVVAVLGLSVVLVFVAFGIFWWIQSPSIGPAMGGRPEKPTMDKDGWVSLFNGKDLTVWTAEQNNATNWKVENGGIVGRLGTLRSRKTYQDFRVRMEVKLVGNEMSDFRFRSAGNLWAYAPIGNRWRSECTGSLAFWDNGKSKLLVDHENELIHSAKWFTLEVFVQGKKVFVSLNGVISAEHEIERMPDSGFFEFEIDGKKTELHIRKIEIKELPPTPTPPNKKANWVQLFNGKDLTGWKTDPRQPGGWRVENGELIADGSVDSYFNLYTVRDDYEDFHLRAEVNIMDHQSGGLWVRAPFGPFHKGILPIGYGVDLENGKDRIRKGIGTLRIGRDPIRQTNADVMPGEWLLVEVTAKGNHFTVKVNGKQTAEGTDEQRLHASGCIALSLAALNKAPRALRFRKIEIKELTPTPTNPKVE